MSGRGRRDDSLAARVMDVFEEPSFVVSRVAGPEPNFLPRRYFDSLVTRSEIKKELRRGSRFIKLPKELIDFIEIEAKKIFLTGLFANLDSRPLYQFMKRCRETGFNDSRLPVGPDCQKDGFKEIFYPFKATTKRVFYQTQWTFLAPVFNSEEFSYNFSPCTILPFFRQPADTITGAFSEVSKITIHPDHFKAETNGAPTVIAIKHIILIDPENSQEEAGVRVNFQTEVQTLSKISKIRHRHIIETLFAITQGRDNYYILFKWADGGSVRDLWRRRPFPERDSVKFRQLVEDSVQQITGLADALWELHRVGLRHGDMKPDNLLVFINDQPSSPSTVGTWKIADFGLAKEHNYATNRRPLKTTAVETTQHYESPEVRDAMRGEHGYSRLADIWSLGCVIFEHIVWMLYGLQDVERLGLELKNSVDQTLYFRRRPGGTKEVHPIATRWMGHIAELSECRPSHTPLGDLLKIVQKDLIVVAWPENWDRPEDLTAEDRGKRIPTWAFLDSMKEIQEKMRHTPAYCEAGSPTLPRPPVGGTTVIRDFVGTAADDRLLPGAAADIPRGVLSRQGALFPQHSLPQVVGGTRKDYKHALERRYDKVWTFEVDNKFAFKVLQEVGNASMSPPYLNRRTESLCSRCLSQTFWATHFVLEDYPARLKQRQVYCTLCKMMLDACEREGLVNELRVSFFGRGSTIMLQDRHTPAFSIVRSPASQINSPIQLGFPELKSEHHFDIIRLWLRTCDEEHQECRPNESTSLPTRVIDVGEKGSTNVRLFKPLFGQKGQYIALSHPWGAKSEQNPHFSTNPSSEARHESGIHLASLPKTYQDAVIATRELSQRYLWIDSICIVQGEGGDFPVESTKMQQYYSGAYCVIAASRATEQASGFLQPRQKRRVVTLLDSSDSPVYVCENIDNFNDHVVESSLGKRGWVLQERALAKRTIFFAEKQTYWECSGGVRCETLTKMKNNIAAFMGDPSFPQFALQETHGGKIRLYQHLFEEYSRLLLSCPWDRAIAIGGLESRLRQGYQTDGQFGIFHTGPADGFLHRSLLWHRHEDCPALKRIRYDESPSSAPVRRVPTWSWMAYSGPISYMDIEGGTTEWETRDLISPWYDQRPSGVGTQGERSGTSLYLHARVRDLHLQGSKVKLDAVLDCNDDSNQAQFKGVIVGREGDLQIESRAGEDRMYYILLVMPSFGPGTAGDGMHLYNRVGVAALPGKCIDLSGDGEEVRIE